MSNKDPLQWCGEIAWYLTESLADLGIRSSFASQVAAIEGSTGSGSAGAERYLALTSRYRANSPIARDRVMRRRWAQLGSFHRDLLCVHYTGRCIVEESTGFRRFPRGLESQLGLFTAVAHYLAKLAGVERAFLIAGENGKVFAPTLSVEDEDTIRRLYGLEPNQKVTARHWAQYQLGLAHKAYYDLLAAEAPEVEPEHDGFADLAEELAELSGVYSVSNTVQRDGRWVQR